MKFISVVPLLFVGLLAACKQPMKGDMCGTVTSVKNVSSDHVYVQFTGMTRPYDMYWTRPAERMSRLIQFKPGQSYMMVVYANPAQPYRLILGAEKVSSCAEALQR
jgi:hypothetical protein